MPPSLLDHLLDGETAKLVLASKFAKFRDSFHNRRFGVAIRRNQFRHRRAVSSDNNFFAFGNPVDHF